MVRRLHGGEIDKFSIEKRYLHSSGAILWVNLTVAHIRSPDNQPSYDVSVIDDITARKQIEHTLERMAKYDALSGLPNRNLLKDRLDQAKARAHRAGQLLGFALFDLDRF